MVFKDDQYVVHEDGMAESCRAMRLVRMEESRMRSRSRRHIREGIISAPRVPYDCGKARGRVGRRPSRHALWPNKRCGRASKSVRTLSGQDGVARCTNLSQRFIRFRVGETLRRLRFGLLARRYPLFCLLQATVVRVSARIELQFDEISKGLDHHASYRCIASFTVIMENIASFGLCELSGDYATDLTR